MHRGNCRVCGKSLKDEPAALIMDSAGYRYHFSCWRNLMDVRIQENRDAIARRRQKIEKSRRSWRPKEAWQRKRRGTAHPTVTKSMILHLTPLPAALVGETPAE